MSTKMHDEYQAFVHAQRRGHPSGVQTSEDTIWWGTQDTHSTVGTLAPVYESVVKDYTSVEPVEVSIATMVKKHTKKDLLQIADDRGLDIKTSASKVEIATAIFMDQAQN